MAKQNITDTAAVDSANTSTNAEAEAKEKNIEEELQETKQEVEKLKDILHNVISLLNLRANLYDDMSANLEANDQAIEHLVDSELHYRITTQAIILMLTCQVVGMTHMNEKEYSQSFKDALQNVIDSYNGAGADLKIEDFLPEIESFSSSSKGKKNKPKNKNNIFDFTNFKK